MIHFRILGDIHGEVATYRRYVKDIPYTLQLGDLGWREHYDLAFDGIDPARHKFLPGNHDDYTPELVDQETAFTSYDPFTRRDNQVYKFVNMPPHFLGNYGVWQVPETDKKIFFIRGAWSIDKNVRLMDGRPWYECEQLSRSELYAALELYTQEKPDFVVAHECPHFVMQELQLNYSEGKAIHTLTGDALQAMWETHRPAVFCFGHYHQSFRRKIDGTEFICLDKARQDWESPHNEATVGYLDLDKELNIHAEGRTGVLPPFRVH